MSSHLVEETAEAAIVFIRLLGLLLLLLLSSSGGGSLGSSRGGGSISLGVSNAVFELLDLGPAEVGLDGNGKNLLVGVDDRVDDGGQSGEVDGERDGGNGGNSRGERLEELLLADIEDTSGESVTLVVDLGDAHTVGEGRDVQQVEEGSLGGADLVTCLDELEIGGDFNGTTGDLGGDTESLEEGGLAGFHTGVASGDPHVDGGNSTGTSGGSNLVGKNLVAGLLEVGVGEDKTNVALDVGEETLVLGNIGKEGLEGTANL